MSCPPIRPTPSHPAEDGAPSDLEELRTTHPKRGTRRPHRLFIGDGRRTSPVSPQIPRPTTRRHRGFLPMRGGNTGRVSPLDDKVSQPCGTPSVKRATGSQSSAVMGAGRPKAGFSLPVPVQLLWTRAIVKSAAEVALHGASGTVESPDHPSCHTSAPQLHC